MIDTFEYISAEENIKNNLQKLKKFKCDSHKKHQASYFCINPNCINNSTSFLCELCVNNHHTNHAAERQIKSIDYLFSVKLLDQIKEECKITSSRKEDTIRDLKKIDDIFDDLKTTLCNIIASACNELKDNMKLKIQSEDCHLKDTVKGYEKMLSDLFSKDDLPDIKNFIQEYVNNFSKLSEVIREQIKKAEEFDTNISELDDCLKQRKIMHSELIDMVNKKIKDETLEEKILDNIKNIKLEELNLPRIHTKEVNKILVYDDKNYITCSADTSIIIRNKENNTINQIFHHNDQVKDIILLKDGRLASCSVDTSVKIWNLKDNKCEQSLFGHTHTVCSLLELPHSKLLTGSEDQAIIVWDISKKDKVISDYCYKIKHDKQRSVTCMNLITSNLLAAASLNDINIYIFDDLTYSKFDIIRVLKGHKKQVTDLKIMKDCNDLLVSCSFDDYCKLWSISKEICLKNFNSHGHNASSVRSILILSSKIFASAGTEIKFWNIDEENAIATIIPRESIANIIPRESKKRVLSLIRESNNTFIFGGFQGYLGFLKF